MSSASFLLIFNSSRVKKCLLPVPIQKTSAGTHDNVYKQFYELLSLDSDTSYIITFIISTCRYKCTKKKILACEDIIRSPCNHVKLVQYKEWFIRDEP